jgi:hypothetical protein
MSEGSIIQAVKAGNIKVLKKASKKDLLKADESGWCSIHWAAWSGNKEVMATLLHKWLVLSLFCEPHAVFGEVCLHTVVEGFCPQHGLLKLIMCAVGGELWKKDTNPAKGMLLRLSIDILYYKNIYGLR